LKFTDYCNRICGTNLKRKKETALQTFGQRVRELRRTKNLGQRALAAKVGVSFTYVSRIENENLDFGPYPSEELICKLAKALDADADELLLLAKKVPEGIKRRVLERPDAFRKLAALDDKTLDGLLVQIEPLPQKMRRKRLDPGEP
jgi:HTH-type transcriptional regulator, competence development regulator